MIYHAGGLGATLKELPVEAALVLSRAKECSLPRSLGPAEVSPYRDSLQAPFQGVH